MHRATIVQDPSEALYGGLDTEMRVRIWNRRAEEMWGVRADEVVNRHFLNLDIGLPVAKVTPIIRATMDDGSEPHSLTLDAINRRGRKIQCRVTSRPLMTLETAAPQGAIVVMEEVGAD